MYPKLNENADIELSEKLRNLRRGQYWATKYSRKKWPPNEADIARDVAKSSEQDGKNTTTEGRIIDNLPAKSIAPELSHRSSRLQIIKTSTHTPETTKDMSDDYTDMNELCSALPRRTPSVGPVRPGTAATDNSGDHWSPDGHPDVSMAGSGGHSCPAHQKASEVYRHRREFSFDPGEDGISPLPLVGVAHSTNGQDNCADGSVLGGELLP